MPSIPDTDFETHRAALFQRLAATKGFLRHSGKLWVVLDPRGRPVQPGFASPDLYVSILRDRGHLVERPGGGLELLSQRLERTGRFSDHRPAILADFIGKLDDTTPDFNLAESPLSWLRARKDKQGRPLIGAAQFLAGERLRADYERACLERRTTASWDPSATVGRSGSRPSEISDSAIAARQRLQRALDAVGPELAGILIQVCCLAAGIEQAERILELPQRSGKAVLGLALTGLARHYGLIKAAAKPAGHLGHWALPDYRPGISAAEES